MRKLIVAALAAAALPGLAQAAAFTNGSFELGRPIPDPLNPNTSPGGFSQLIAGTATADDIDGWLVTSGDIDYIGAYWNAAAGVRSVDLSGAGAGTLAQTFDTVAGQAYSVGFFLAANAQGAPGLKTATVSATGNATANYSIASTGLALPAMNWTAFSYNFVATGASTTLSFASTTSGSFGPALDNVSVAAVPEPTTWTMLIGGFGAIGGTLRRRRAAATLAAA